MDGRIDREDPRGFSLLEVLITVLVLSVGLLGLAALQIAGMRDMQGAYLKTQAVNRSHQIVDLMRANRGAVRAGAYDDAFGQDAGSYCGNDGPDTARGDLCAWKRALSATLPAGTGSIAFDGKIATVCIRWIEPVRGHEIDADDCGDAAGSGSAAWQLFKLQTVL